MVISSTERRRRFAPAAELVVQAALVAAAWLLVIRLGGLAAALSTEVVAFFASLLLGVVALTDADDRTRCVAAAIGGYTGVELLLRAADAEPSSGVQAVCGSVAVLGVVGLLVLAVRGPSDYRVDRVVGVGALVVLLCGTTGLVVTGLVPGLALPAGLVAATELVAWSGAGAAGMLLLIAGTVVDSPLLRRAGIGFAAVGIANAVRIIEGNGETALVGAFELGAAAMFLVAAAPVVLEATGRVRRPRPYERAFRSNLSRSNLSNERAVRTV